MGLDVHILPAAIEDADNIFDYIAMEDPDAAERLLVKITGAMKSLGENPQRGARIRNKLLATLDFRFLLVEPYLIFYKVEDQGVFIHHIIHQRRNPASVLMDGPMPS